MMAGLHSHLVCLPLGHNLAIGESDGIRITISYVCFAALLEIYHQIGSVGDKVKAKKSHYHHRYVCCIGSRSKNNSSGIKKTRWQDSQRIKNKETSW